jgi:hypothetical protein
VLFGELLVDGVEPRCDCLLEKLGPSLKIGSSRFASDTPKFLPIEIS